MIKHLFTSIFFLAAGILHAQMFEGTLNYKTEYNFDISPEMAKIGVTKETLIQKMKDGGTWSDSVRITYKGNNYIMYTNFSPAAWSVYKGVTNKIYSFREDDAEDICTVIDASIDLEEKMTGIKPVITKLRNRVDVNGKMCDVVEVTWKSGSYDYYYQPNLFNVDTNMYSDYIYDGWAGYLKISHALPIRIVKSMSGLGNVTFTLTSYKEEIVDDNIFNIPELIPDASLNVIKIPNRELMRIKK